MTLKQISDPHFFALIKKLDFHKKIDINMTTVQYLFTGYINEIACANIGQYRTHIFMSLHKIIVPSCYVRYASSRVRNNDDILRYDMLH